MIKYTEQQSIVIALWVLSLNPRPITGPYPPEFLTEIVNALGGQHSAGSILLHTHGYEVLFMGRDIDRHPTNLQLQVAQTLLQEGIAEIIHEV